MQLHSLDNLPVQDMESGGNESCGICREELLDPVKNEACRHYFEDERGDGLHQRIYRFVSIKRTITLAGWRK